MQSVFLLVKEYGYGKEAIVSGYSTEELAKRALNNYLLQDPYAEPYLVVREIFIDKDDYV